MIPAVGLMASFHMYPEPAPDSVSSVPFLRVLRAIFAFRVNATKDDRTGLGILFDRIVGPVHTRIAGTIPNPPVCIRGSIGPRRLFGPKKA